MSFALAPLHCRSLQLTEQGLVLGDGVVVAPLERKADGNSVLAVEGRDAEIFALLSLAQGRAISPNILHGLLGVAKSFARGDAVGAAFRLALLGLPPLRGPRDAEMLKTGATFLARRFSPWAILREAGIEGPAVELCKAQWDENLHPRDPVTGRFIEAGSGTVVTASAARALIAAGATQISAGAFALAGGALLSLTAAGWVLSHGPKGNIEDGPSYWLPGVAGNRSRFFSSWIRGSFFRCGRAHAALRRPISYRHGYLQGDCASAGSAIRRGVLCVSLGKIRGLFEWAADTAIEHLEQLSWNKKCQKSLHISYL